MRFIKSPNAFLILAFLTLLLTVWWYSLSSYRAFQQHHQQLAEHSAEGVAHEIELLINEQQRLLNLFIHREDLLLQRLVENPNDYAANTELRSKVDIYFPERFAFTIASKEGVPLLRKGQELIGGACRRDIKTFTVNSKDHAVHVHPSPGTDKFHFDLMNTIHTSSGKLSVFFVSFFLNDLARIMNHGKVVGHELVLVKKGEPSIIEISTTDNPAILSLDNVQPQTIPSGKKGTERMVWMEDYRQKTIVSIDIPGTYWSLNDIPDSTVLTARRYALLSEAFWVLLLFLVFAALVSWLLKIMGVVTADTRTVLNAVENDRKRIAMDLHDHVLSGFAHLRRACHRLPETPGPDPEQAISTIDADMDQITHAIRDAINDLHPQSLGLIGLEDTLRNYVNKHFESGRPPVFQLQIEDWEESRLNDEQRLHLFRIIQEVLTNIEKHAQAEHCEFSMRMNTSRLLIKIMDNGKSNENTSMSKKTAGRGMANIKIRSRLLGAAVNWQCKKTGGICFELTMPLENYDE
ncbi:MAG: ATP-binding protein [Gammaproteobacteria bacterium]